MESASLNDEIKLGED